VPRKDERPPFYPGMGVRFLEIDAKDKARIDKFVKAAVNEKDRKRVFQFLDIRRAE